MNKESALNNGPLLSISEVHVCHYSGRHIETCFFCSCQKLPYMKAIEKKITVLNCKSISS